MTNNVANNDSGNTTERTTASITELNTTMDGRQTAPSVAAPLAISNVSITGEAASERTEILSTTASTWAYAPRSRFNSDTDSTATPTNDTALLVPCPTSPSVVWRHNPTITTTANIDSNVGTIAVAPDKKSSANICKKSLAESNSPLAMARILSTTEPMYSSQNSSRSDKSNPSRDSSTPSDTLLSSSVANADTPADNATNNTAATTNNSKLHTMRCAFMRGKLATNRTSPRRRA